jgi:hypothetical protein
MNSHPVFIRRLGQSPKQANTCTRALECPDILELASGDFAIIGKDITEESAAHLPKDAGCGPGERVILIPRKTLVFAKQDIPNQP